MVAQSFIHKHELPQAYLDQVANFIVTNSDSTPVIETSLSGSYHDPFTGEGRYIPGSGSNRFGPGTGNVDPFTSGSSYSSQSTASVPVNFVPRSGQKTQSSSAKHFPYGQYTTIVACDPAKVLSKLRLELYVYINTLQTTICMFFYYSYDFSEFNSSMSETSSKVSESDLGEAIKLASGVCIALTFG